MNTPTRIITHHSASSYGTTAQDVDAWHKVRWSGFTSKFFKNQKREPYHVGYHYVIEWGGKIVQTRDESEEGAHCIGMNNSSIGICFMGNFDLHMPSEPQKASFQKLYGEIVKRHPQLTPENIVPHRKYANKSCHGKLLSDTFFAELVSTEALKKRIIDLQALIIKLRSLIQTK